MSVYMMVEIMEIRDPETYRSYIEKVKELVVQQGGKYLSRGSNITPISGDWTPKRMILIEFPSMESVQNCFNSTQYREIAPLREKATLSRAIIIEGTVD